VKERKGNKNKTRALWVKGEKGKKRHPQTTAIMPILGKEIAPLEGGG